MKGGDEVFNLMSLLFLVYFLLLLPLFHKYESFWPVTYININVLKPMKFLLCIWSASRDIDYYYYIELHFYIYLYYYKYIF